MITYEKGAWIFHMLRRRLGDDRFLKMLAELRHRYEFRAASTEDLRALAKEFLPPKTPASTMETFFENWVYSTGMPGLKLKYTISGTAPNVKVSGTLTQTGVDDDFAIEAPLDIQFAKGTSQTIWLKTSSEVTPFSVTLKQAPQKVSISSGVLAKK
jgi:aminopeptidase N